ncbi:hypothetical protein ACFXDE_31020 [Kitasatospora sp. NPDC059408]|uniref:hypothetical protein n=1 Tax=Kitasatospora sp. NPDC059408 TaxID=3346823 RepID=UPI0036B30F46
MDGIWNPSAPGGCASNLIETAVSLHDKEIAALQSEALQLALEEFNFVNFVKLEAPASDVGHAEEWERVLAGAPFLLLLDSTAHLGNL